MCSGFRRMLRSINRFEFFRRTAIRASLRRLLRATNLPALTQQPFRGGRGTARLIEQSATEGNESFAVSMIRVAKGQGAPLPCGAKWAISAAVAQLLYTELVGGSNPSSPTRFSREGARS